MSQQTKEVGRADHASLHTKCLLLAEIVGVFTIGVVVLLSGLKLFGQSQVVSIASIWFANLMMLSAIYSGLRLRGQSWNHFGLGHNVFDPKSILWIMLRSIPVFVFAIFAFVVGAIVMANIVGVPETADMSKYYYLRGNLGLTILALASVYVVSSFAEELIYRGFLITRTMELGSGNRMSTCFAIAFSSLVFGLVHSDWGLPGMVQASFMGVALGVSYLVVGRNLWVTILAHAYMDTILILQMYWPNG